MDKNFLSLPAELLDCIIKNLGFPWTGLPELAALERVSKRSQKIIEPYLYFKILTNNKFGKTSMSTRGMVALFARRPHLTEFVHGLIVDEYDPSGLRDLLKIEFPNLEVLFMQHSGPMEHRNLSWRELEDISDHWRPQPKIQNLVLNFDVEPKKGEVPTPKSGFNFKMVQKWRRLLNFDVEPNEGEVFTPKSGFNFKMIDHPSLTRIRLTHLDITGLAKTGKDYYRHARLDELFIEVCPCSPASLERLIAPSRCLRTLILHDFRTPPFSTTNDNMTELMRAIMFTSPTLVVFKMSWQDMGPPEAEWEGFDFSTFAALRHLHLPPSFIFTSRRYPSPDEASCVKNLKDTLPPRLKILSLESLIPINPEPAPPEGMGLKIGQRDEYLLSALLNHKNEIAPCLTRIFGYYDNHLTEDVRGLVDLAIETGVFLLFPKEGDNWLFDMEWLCADGNDPMTTANL